MTKRIIRAVGMADPSDVADGMAWYRTAHDQARIMAISSGLDTGQVAGIIAALSPQMEWMRNLRLAEQLLTDGTARGQTGLCVARALAIRDGAHPLDVLGGNKVRSFFDNIAHPETSRAVTIDRHAYDVATGTIGDDRSRKALERAGVYETVADAYRSAADRLGIAPCEIQAICWTSHRRAKVQTHGYRGRPFDKRASREEVIPI